MNKFVVSPSFSERVVNTFGIQGELWLKKLPLLILECEELYEFKVTQQYQHQSFNFTGQAVSTDGAEAVVKLCVPSDEVTQEIDALEFMRGEGVVKLIKADKQNGFLLLEKLNPGNMLSDEPDDKKATIIAAQIMKRIWKPITKNNSYKTTQQWFSRLNKPVEVPATFPTTLIDRARKIADELHQDMGEPVLLHGDLHHFNILSADRQPWLAIDPKGVVGEREYEAGAFLRNPIPSIASSMPTKKLLTERVEIFAQELGFDKQRIQAWGFAQAVLAAIWCIDTQQKEWKLFLTCAKALA
jgi:streptomycin 6-kinase